MNFQKEVKEIEQELLDIKSSQRVASTAKVYTFKKSIRVPALTTSGYGAPQSVRLSIAYKDTGQPVISDIPVYWREGKTENYGPQAGRSVVSNLQQYVWLSVTAKDTAATYTFRMTSTAIVEDVVLAME